MATVLITGGSGLIGRNLSRRLQERGYEIAFLSRTTGKDQHIPTYIWDIDKSEIDAESIASADYIIHLSGTNIGAKRWTDKRRQQIVDSRVRSAELIFDAVKNQDKKLKAFISASATGYYGAVTSDEIFRESDQPGNDFLGRICREWEQVADRFQELGIRTVKLRTGVVLTKEGGALSKMSLPVKAGVGSALGTGKQYLPWIHMDDLCGIYLKAVEDTQMAGAYNAVAPEHVTNKKFTQSLAKILKRPFWFPNVPSFVLKMLFGRMSVILLEGSRVSAEKIQKAGYRFLFPHAESALKQIMHRENMEQ
jgi:uncharacterized protein (TIGR01777 family)